MWDRDVPIFANSLFDKKKCNNTLHLPRSKQLRRKSNAVKCTVAYWPVALEILRDHFRLKQTL